MGGCRIRNDTVCTTLASWIKQILERIDDAISQTKADVRQYVRQNSEFAEVGERMLEEWEIGASLSLRPGS